MKQNNIDVEKFNIAKSRETFDKSIKVDIIEYEVGNFDNESNVLKKKKKYLEFTIFGKVDDENYSLHFILSKPFSFYDSLVDYEKVRIKQTDVIDSYLMIDDVAILDLALDITLVKFSSFLDFSLSFRDCEFQFYGNIELSVDCSFVKLIK